MLHVRLSVLTHAVSQYLVKRAYTLHTFSACMPHLPPQQRGEPPCTSRQHTNYPYRLHSTWPTDLPQARHISSVFYELLPRSTSPSLHRATKISTTIDSHTLIAWGLCEHCLLSVLCNTDGICYHWSTAIVQYLQVLAPRVVCWVEFTELLEWRFIDSMKPLILSKVHLWQNIEMPVSINVVMTRSCEIRDLCNGWNNRTKALKVPTLLEGEALVVSWKWGKKISQITRRSRKRYIGRDNTNTLLVA